VQIKHCAEAIQFHEFDRQVVKRSKMKTAAVETKIRVVM